MGSFPIFSFRFGFVFDFLASFRSSYVLAGYWILVALSAPSGGCVPADRINQFRDRLKEGSVYTFEMFIVPNRTEVQSN
jgi:hypothetical protein